ncbi:hypothetical protein CRE_28563 [Caenorhabditis remanei]|uniref:Uncharacterized protein n=1 Tax=Caenorhabditis remanei TaxID=31234 RepID=E3LN25_CAERE|nr:hypothetical protein CRE_28563 [Caenorhabditis remanei]
MSGFFGRIFGFGESTDGTAAEEPKVGEETAKRSESGDSSDDDSSFSFGEDSSDDEKMEESGERTIEEKEEEICEESIEYLLDESIDKQEYSFGEEETAEDSGEVLIDNSVKETQKESTQIDINENPIEEAHPISLDSEDDLSDIEFCYRNETSDEEDSAVNKDSEVSENPKENDKEITPEETHVISEEDSVEIDELVLQEDGGSESGEDSFSYGEESEASDFEEFRNINDEVESVGSCSSPSNNSFEEYEDAINTEKKLNNEKVNDLDEEKLEEYEDALNTDLNELAVETLAMTPNDDLELNDEKSEERSVKKNESDVFENLSDDSMLQEEKKEKEVIEVIIDPEDTSDNASQLIDFTMSQMQQLEMENRDEEEKLEVVATDSKGDVEVVEEEITGKSEGLKNAKTDTLTTDGSINKKRKSKLSKEHILAYEEYIRATEAYEFALEQHVRQLERCLAVNEKILRITGTAK